MEPGTKVINSTILYRVATATVVQAPATHRFGKDRIFVRYDAAPGFESYSSGLVAFPSAMFFAQFVEAQP
jgi:hypothetical protein